MQLDAIELEVIKSRLEEAVLTMQNQLFHSGYSPVLRESEDGSASITDRNGGLVVAGGSPIHGPPYYRTIQGVLKTRGKDLKPGCSYLINDPYIGGNHHVPDTAMVTPFFYKGELVAFATTIAHKADIGGMVIGSSSPSAREIYHEGLLFPAVEFWTEDGPNMDFERFLRGNTRAPDEVIGDMRAQVGATRLGCRRLQELFDRYGPQIMLEAFEGLITSAEQRMRAEIAKLPDGVTEAEGFLDHDMVSFDKPVGIRVKLTKQGDQLTLDFSGSDPSGEGPINIRPQTLEAGANVALLAVLNPTIEVNDGIRRAITYINPEGSVVHAQKPRPMNNYFPALYISYCVTQMALAKLAPDKAVAPVGLGTGSIAFGYRRNSPNPIIQYELIVPSLGGTPHVDGAFMVVPASQHTPSQPIEVVEVEGPVETLRFEPIIDSAGPGRRRGGPGWVREYKVLEEAMFTIRTGHFKFGAWGVNGGGAPDLARCVINMGTDREEVLPIMATRILQPGDVVTVELSGGGGCGPAVEREPERVLRDVQDGIVSLKAAREVYKVAIVPDTLTVDEAGTASLRGGEAVAKQVEREPSGADV